MNGKVKVTIWLPAEVDKGLEIAMAKMSLTKSGIIEALLKGNFPVEIAQAKGVIARARSEK